MKKITGTERKSDRLGFPISLRYHVYNSPESPKDTSTTDISEGGLRFNCPENFKLDTVLELEIGLPGRIKPLKVRGKVARSQQIETSKYDVGVSFIEMEEADKKELLFILSTVAYKMTI